MITCIMPSSWNIKGIVLIACNCDYGCPCNFNAPPSHGKCEGAWTWHVNEGAFDGVPLDGLNFSLFAKWPGAIHLGNGEAVMFIDERANQRQRDAIARLLTGEVGGPWGILGKTWPKIHGTKFVAYDLQEKGLSTTLKGGSCFELEFTTIKNPVSGADVHPSMTLPEGMIVKQAELGASKAFRINDAIAFDHSGKYTAIGKFDYAGSLPA